MLTKRIIACLDVSGGRVVKGVQFVNLRDAGDPAELAELHSSAGADEIVLLDISAALNDPGLITCVAERFGSQAVIVAIDAKHTGNGHYEVFARGGRTATGRDACLWAKEAESRGAGEILLTSMDRDGTGAGFDCHLTRSVGNG